MEYKGVALRTRDRGFKELEVRKDKVSNALTSVQSDSLVLVTPKLINTQSKSTKNTSRSIKTMETVQKLNGKMCQILKCWSEGSLAKRSLLQENEVDLRTPEVLSFLKSQDALKKNSHAFVCLKTSKACYHTTKEQHSYESLPRWMNLGMTANGKCLTLKTSVSHKTENECSLSDILGNSVDQKYFLSEHQVAKLSVRL